MSMSRATIPARAVRTATVCARRRAGTATSKIVLYSGFMASSASSLSLPFLIPSLSLPLPLPSLSFPLLSPLTSYFIPFTDIVRVLKIAS